MNKKGFTLIELLAVIVILAIIALIATPIVLNIISETKETATLRSADFYMDAVEQSVMLESINNATFNPSECQIESTGNLLCSGNVVKVDVQGTLPDSGTIKFEDGEIIDVTLMYDDKVITLQNGNLAYLKAGLYDAEGNLIATWDELVKDGIKLDIDYFDEEGEEEPNFEIVPGVLLSNYTEGSKLIIDSSVKKIGSAALTMNETLKEVIIPNSVTSIGEGAFGYCTSLEEIIIPEGVTSIGDSVFYGCTNLKEIIIPDSVTSIGNYAFDGCTNLKEIVIGDGITYLDDINFQSIPNLQTLVIGNGVTSIGLSLFAGCVNLKEITIGNKVTIIEKDAFYGCESLASVKLSNSLEKIGFNAFENCQSLTSITIPRSVTTIENAAFDGVYLKTINYVGTQDEWNSIDLGEHWLGDSSIQCVINYNYKG